MEFYTSYSTPRPVRLSEATRQFAYDSIHFQYGQDTRKTPHVDMGPPESYEALSPLERHDLAVRTIVTQAPLRICDGELLSGAATLGIAIQHGLPAYFEGKTHYMGSISHLTTDFFEVLAIGMDGIREKVTRSLEHHTDPKKIAFLHSCLSTIESMELWHKRYLDALKDRPGFEKNYQNLSRVPFQPARNFHEAVQCVWFCFAFLRLLGNWPGIGRIDQMLGDYLKADLANGTLTLDEAREILAHFFIKGCEWITGEPTRSGDAQHYQNLVLSGIDANGKDVTNEVTYLVLDVIEETGISDFPTTVRLNKNTDETLLRRISEVIRFGGGVLAVYNEDLILESLADMGYPPEEARSFANDGCWEVQVPGKTTFSYLPFDSLAILQDVTLKKYDGSAIFSDFDALFARYLSDLRDKVETLFRENIQSYFDANGNFRPSYPCTAVSLFEHDCIGRGLSYNEGGPIYTVCSPHIGGLADTVNSLYAIKKAVFEEKILSLADLMAVLRENWENDEALRRQIANRYVYYGNDNDEVDQIAVDILAKFSEFCREFDGKTPIRVVSGVSTFGRQIDWSPYRAATAYGRKQGEILAGNMSPTPGTDHNGAASILKSYCKADLKKQHTGAALDIGLVASNLEGENAVEVLSGLLRSFVALGGFFLQIDTVDKATLIEAQKHPENYRSLSVRISGWNARFATLSKEWQDMVIQRAK